MPIFDGFTDDEVDRIKNAGTFVTLPADWSPIWEKTPADKAYILLSGEVSVRRGGEEIARLGPGDIIGEAAIVEPLAAHRLHRQPEQAGGAPLHQRRRPRAERRGPRVPRGARPHRRQDAPGGRRVGRVTDEERPEPGRGHRPGTCSARSPTYTRREVAERPASPSRSPRSCGSSSASRAPATTTSRSPTPTSRRCERTDELISLGILTDDSQAALVRTWGRSFARLAEWQVGLLAGVRARGGRPDEERLTS